MPLGHIDIRFLRNLSDVSLDFAPSLNLIYGDNASGKTSLLEAMYLLAMGRSFRSHRVEHLIQHGQEAFSIKALNTSEKGQAEMMLRQGKGQRKMSINGAEDVRLVDMTRMLPVMFISPEGHHEFLHDSQLRRSAMDWLVFHVEPEFQALWSRYRRLLKQRNTALKARASKASITAWDPELVKVAEAITGLRRRPLQRLQAIVAEYADRFDYPDEVSLVFNAGWDVDLGLAMALKKNFEQDYMRGHTSSGPHRADLQLFIGDERLQHVASHGQQRLIVSTFRFAQLALFKECVDHECILLLDDLVSELDRHFQRHLLELINGLEIQTFVTATEREYLQQFDWPEYTLFHVEQGKIEAL
jgi:DNA replication and repair protein RecF